MPNSAGAATPVSSPVPEARPVSEVDALTGLAGAAALGIALYLARANALATLPAMLLCLGAPALAMALWGVLVEKVHRRPSTGLDFALRRPFGEVASITQFKVVGLGVTFCLFAAAYACIRTYATPGYAFYLEAAAAVAPAVWMLSPLYFGLTTRHMREPRDGLWHLGRLACLDRAAVDMPQVWEHLRSWTVKAFFLAFMISILPEAVNGMLKADPAAAFKQPLQAILLLIRTAFFFDICFGTIGYLMTLRVLDSHIRSAQPRLAGWAAALACYPPFALMTGGGPLDYTRNTQEWMVWMNGQPGLLIAWGAGILALTVVYAWATVIFGIRFSNLTHRGIITAGPYRYSRHPAYLSKNLAWWMIHLPFLSTAGGAEALRNCALLLLVNALYYARARTEENHLMADPRYQAYSAWMREHGLLARMGRRLRGWLPATAASRASRNEESSLSK